MTHGIPYILEITSSLLAILSANETRQFTDEEKMSIIEGIIETAKKGMETITTEKSAKSRAKNWSRKHKQSKKDITYHTILSNLLSDKQTLPARPRDFRLKLGDSEKDIGCPELSDILARFIDIGMLDNKRTRFPASRGRPKSGSMLSEERRGRFSHYTLDKIKDTIDQVLEDPEVIKLITNALLSTDLLHRFLKYSFTTAFYQMKEDENAFFRTFEPVGVNKQHTAINKNEAGPWILVKNLSEKHLESLADKYALITIAQFKQNGNKAIYTIVGLLHYGRTYDS